MGKFGQERVNLNFSPGLGVVRQLARFVGGVLKPKNLIWLPKTYTDPKLEMENFGDGAFSRLLTTRGVSEMCPFCTRPPHG